MGVKDYCCHIRCGEWKERTQMMNYHSRLTSATIESTCKAAQVSSYQVKQVKKKKKDTWTSRQSGWVSSQDPEQSTVNESKYKF